MTFPEIEFAPEPRVGAPWLSYVLTMLDFVERGFVTAFAASFDGEVEVSCHRGHGAALPVTLRVKGEVVERYACPADMRLVYLGR